MSKCVRCGYCCIDSWVIIINPNSVSPNLNMNKLTEKDVLSKETGEMCPHLIKENDGTYSCSIHDYNWYVETPCYAYQNDGTTHNCRLGEYMLSKNK